MSARYALLTLSALVIAGCGVGQPMGSVFKSTSLGSQAPFSATKSLSVPTSMAIVGRIENGLEKNATATAGNFAKAVTQLRNNLPSITDPSKATGYDQVQVLAYAACSDLTVGSNPKMKTQYNVDPAGPISSNQSSLVAAGMKMLDNYVGGLASQSDATVQVRGALQSLVQQSSSVASNNSKIAFMSVCMAANTVGATMLGF